MCTVLISAWAGGALLRTCQRVDGQNDLVFARKAANSLADGGGCDRGARACVCVETGKCRFEWLCTGRSR